MATVTIYSTPTCQYCKAAKTFFKEKGVEFTEKDAAGDQAAAQEMQKISGGLSVPVIVIDKDGKQEVVVGFDQGKLSSILGV
tara:strand:+ start:550 stop:795 length:246 start_codon:yes stop_codon:yes gene_type:complete